MLKNLIWSIGLYTALASCSSWDKLPALATEQVATSVSEIFTENPEMTQWEIDARRARLRPEVQVSPWRTIIEFPFLEDTELSKNTFIMNCNKVLWKWRHKTFFPIAAAAKDMPLRCSWPWSCHTLATRGYSRNMYYMKREEKNLLPESVVFHGILTVFPDLPWKIPKVIDVKRFQTFIVEDASGKFSCKINTVDAWSWKTLEFHESEDITLEKMQELVNNFIEEAPFSAVQWILEWTLQTYFGWKGFIPPKERTELDERLQREYKGNQEIKKYLEWPSD